MKIYGKDSIKCKTYGELNTGDTFIRVADYSDIENMTVYLRISDSNSSIDLQTGISTVFDKDTPVKCVDAVLKINSNT